MECPFQVGDEVVCVDDTFDPSSTRPASRQFVKGEVTTVVEIYVNSWGPWLVLAGAQNDDIYDPICFRKVERRKDSLSIDAFLTIKPGQFEEPKRAPAKKRERV